MFTDVVLYYKYVKEDYTLLNDRFKKIKELK